MRLTRLELQGFKSFADATDLVFDEGVTAIVGPNGCGKSNVSDAVRWVLGEQRPRLLRGAKMEEVIFQGSSARRPVSLAEVSLHFENEDGQLGVPFREVVITRRLSRSGESEYLLNRAPCRLRDIHDMLRGTGLGAESGVVIEQKMIDALLSDRPDERRELFEEAAGVGLYRDRRRSTERRLEETSTDLQRLDDLIAEVQSQVRSLARQRKRAERHAELTARRFTLEIALTARDMIAWRDELARLEARLEALRAAAPAAEREARDTEPARDAAHAARAEAEGRRAELARLAAEQRENLQELQRELAVAEERHRNALHRRERAEQERHAGEQQGDRLASDLERAAGEVARLEAEYRAADDALTALARAEDDARRVMAEARRGLDEAEARAGSLRERTRALETDRERAAAEQADLLARREILETEYGEIADRRMAAGRELELAREALDAARRTAERASEDAERRQTAARAAREAEMRARSELFRADELAAALRGRVAALETLERERVGLAPAAAALLRDRERFGEGAVLGPISDFVSADAGGALLIERFLGATVHAVLVRDRAAADAVRAWHAQVQPGPLLLLPLDGIGAGDLGPPVAGDLSEQVTVSEPARVWVRAMLGSVRIVGEGDAFVDGRGAVWLPGDAGGPGPLRRRAELLTLRGELTAADVAHVEAARAADAARDALAAADRDAAVATERNAAAQHEVREAGERVTECAHRLERVGRELADASAVLDRLGARHGEIERAVTRLAEDSAAAAASLREETGALARARARHEEAERALEGVREQRTTSQIARAQADTRLQVARDTARRLEAEQAASVERLTILRTELSELSEADAMLAGQMDAWRRDLDAREAALRDVTARLAASEDAVRAADAALEAAEHALDDRRLRAAEASEALHHAELRHTELSGRRNAIRERLEAEWRRPLDELLAQAEPLDLADDVLRAEAETVRAQLDALGPVNVLAIEEHDEIARRFEFLSTQRADLAEAKQSLQQAIREIDATAREMFLATFTQVRENFRQIFMTLFGGGECDLALSAPEQPLDCDIEIHASPRGKRTQRIHLLSSGERALVALSLLFGIFLTRPSPFCLLDEVDAPLDDANIGRFVRMLTEFKTRTQFIVITHNPRTTTEAADAVYGVTMQEPGVSSLVSVRLRGTAVEEAIAGRAREPLAAGMGITTVRDVSEAPAPA